MTRIVVYLVVLPCVWLSGVSVVPGQEQASDRTRRGLLALYDFDSAEGDMVRDRSGVGEPLNLKIMDVKAVRRREGSLEVRGSTVIQSEQPAAKISEAVRQSSEITLEAWIRPAKLDQRGPARIITLSRNPNERNFTLGQEGDRFDVRLRTTRTSTNGVPSVGVSFKDLGTKLTHVVFTRQRNGRARIYLDGKSRLNETVAGDMRGWDKGFQLGLANELSGDRTWQGALHLVALYSQALTPDEVARNFKAGANVQSRELVAAAKADAAREHFERQVAPLLADRCFECHDSTTKKGGLDLSRKATALAGGDSGPAILTDKLADNLLWAAIESGEMPKERPPLSSEEKQFVRQWIESGATWSLDQIDPTVYAQGETTADLWVQRLTVPEYIETVRCAVGVDISREARELLPPDVRADGFSNTAYNLNVDLEHVEAYARLAEIIVGKMDVEAFAKRFSKSRKLEDNEMRELIGKMGQWLLRGPLDDRELTTYRGIASTVALAGGDYEEAVRYTIQALLQSPRFIYRIENQRGDGTAWRVGEFELASRLSYILWGGPPDEALIAAAETGELSDRGKTEQHVRRMLEDPRAKQRSLQFIHEWLDLDRLQNLRPNPKKFPKWDQALAADMRDETLTFFEDVVWKQNRPLVDVLNAQLTYATPRLAKHYGLPPQGKDEDKDKGPRRYDLSSIPGRGGLLTQGGVLTVGGDEASMVARGLFVLRDLLRGSVKDPPPCVDTTPVPTKPGLTQRGIAEARIANANCGGCHVKFEPLAFGLERFDGVGAYHEKDEYGNRLRDDGQVLFPGQEKPIAYQTSAELMDLLAASDRVRECLIWKLAQFALGRPLVAADVPILDKIHQSTKADGTYANVIMAIVMSDLVQTTRTENPLAKAHP